MLLSWVVRRKVNTKTNQHELVVGLFGAIVGGSRCTVDVKQKISIIVSQIAEAEGGRRVFGLDGPFWPLSRSRSVTLIYSQSHSRGGGVTRTYGETYSLPLKFSLAM